MERSEASVPPAAAPSRTTEISEGAAEARVLAQRFSALEDKVLSLVEANKSAISRLDGISALTTEISALKTDVSDLKVDAKTNFFRLLTWAGGSVVIVLGALVTGYFKLDDKSTSLSVRSDDKLNAVNNALIKTSTQLEDLLARIPPASTPVPRR